MSASKSLCRTSGKQSQFAEPWARSRFPATMIPGYASSVFPSHECDRLAIRRVMLEKGECPTESGESRTSGAGSSACG